ncbi:hypothetical protein HWQ46_18100 [Shewanella sp. D64]|uniref:hypothetical protein n=1 Tax=unclassified Shewanella TaxID=196818 RepID=UPI0022BA40B8|nr:MULTISPECIES: hypothetical protein [unclassified Shewanella]MEC4727460.1 hypothetical protein [Shewanella sp. D64]MEC4738131.1 hypothetical protein [Shewanella sp. E94]WBJ96356.1 hypothetical protein HWQ47_04320 [Shewanella sp. MTB7]
MKVAAINASPSVDDRRLEQPHIDQHWHRLSTTQRFAFYTLAKLGYQLLFVRQSSHEKTAVARQDDRLVTIDSEGDINFNPDLVLRENR